MSLLRHSAAERELGELLGRKVDLVSKRALRETLRDGVLLPARLMYAAKRLYLGRETGLEVVYPGGERRPIADRRV